MQEIRCAKCNKLLYRMQEVLGGIGYTKEDADVKPSDMRNGVIECKCPRCGEINKSNFWKY